MGEPLFRRGTRVRKAKEGARHGDFVQTFGLRAGIRDHDGDLELARSRHEDHPQLPLALRLIENTGVQTRHIVQPIAETLNTGLRRRNKVYESEAKARVPAVIQRALDDAELLTSDIDMIIYVSCTGFMMPSLTAWLINTMDFSSDTRQIPIAQLGCAAGGAAINRAHDFCTAYPDANALIVACEFCSLCYQPTDLSVGSLLCNGLFGDGIAAAVVRGNGGTGVHLERNGSYLVPKTEDWIMYDVRATGFHFLLDKRVPGTMEPLAPPSTPSRDSTTGTPPTWTSTSSTRAAPGSSTTSAKPSRSRRPSASPVKILTEYGNIASAVVLDALRRLFDEGGAEHSARGLLAGFGPGIAGNGPGPLADTNDETV